MRQPRSGFGTAVWQGRIIVAGGELLDSNRLTDSIEQYNPTTNSWELLPFNLPIPLHGLPIAAIEDDLFIIGGSELVGDVSNRGRLYRTTLAATDGA